MEQFNFNLTKGRITLFTKMTADMMLIMETKNKSLVPCPSLPLFIFGISSIMQWSLNWYLRIRSLNFIKTLKMLNFLIFWVNSNSKIIHIIHNPKLNVVCVAANTTLCDACWKIQTWPRFYIYIKLSHCFLRTYSTTFADGTGNTLGRKPCKSCYN